MQPPKKALAFLRWFCREDYLEEIEGDLTEVFEKQCESSPREAKWKFAWTVIKYFRPQFMKSFKNSYHPNSFGMYKSYFKIGWRSLIRNRAYSIINVAGLALSIACGIFIFSLVKHNLSFDNFHANSDRIYRIVTEMHRDNIGHTNSVPSPLGHFFRSDYTYGEKVARIYTEQGALVTILQNDEVIKFKEKPGVSFCEPAFFDIFNFPMESGNHARALATLHSAIITERIAQKYFGTQNPIGKTFLLDNKITFTITGVLKNIPSNSDFKSEIFVSYESLQVHNPWLASDTRGWGGISGGMQCFVLIQPDASIDRVEKVLTAYVKVHRANSKNVHHYKLQPLHDIHFNGLYGGAMEKSKLWILTFIGIFLMITACVNFINLATAQALRRSKEVGVRKVLGSFKTQLFWQFIIETSIITLSSIIVAMATAYLLFPYVNNFFHTEMAVNPFSDGSIMLFLLGLGLVVTIFAGYYPGLVLADFRPVAALKGKLTQQNIGGFNTRRTLIVIQFAISQVLIIGMVVIMNQMRFASQADLGFDKDAIVMVAMGSDSTGTRAKAIKTEIARIPSVDKVSLCFTAPSSEEDWGNSIFFDNNSEEVNFRTSMKLADADYLSTFNLTLLAGRNLTPSDTVREVLVNETLVNKLNIASPDDILGHTITANGGSMKGTVVGVVKDFHDKSFHEEISPVLITTSSSNYQNYAVKINAGDTRAALTAIQEIWLQEHPDQVYEYSFLDESIAHFYETEQTMLNLIQVFSCIAIFIGALGLYGLVSFMVSQKIKEIGIRKVLGGTVNHIIWILGNEFIRLIAIAFIIAAPLGWWLMDLWLKGFKFQVGISAMTFIWAIGCSFAVAAVTVSYQVIASARTNPVNSLRSE